MSNGQISPAVSSIEGAIIHPFWGGSRGQGIKVQIQSKIQIQVKIQVKIQIQNCIQIRIQGESQKESSLTDTGFAGTIKAKVARRSRT